MLLTSAIRIAVSQKKNYFSFIKIHSAVGLSTYFLYFLFIYFLCFIFIFFAMGFLCVTALTCIVDKDTLELPEIYLPLPFE